MSSQDELKPSRFVDRFPPAQAGLASLDHVEVEGDPRVLLAARADAALLLAGSHHRGHLAGLWAASITEWLLVRPPAPMLLARHGYPTRTVAWCVDGSVHAQSTGQVFGSLPWAGDVAVYLVAVDDGGTDVERSRDQAAASLPRGVVVLLWINMIMDGPAAIALGLDAAEPEVMTRPPRDPRAPLLPVRRLGVIGLNGAVMALGTLTVLAGGLAVLPRDQAVTLGFTTFVLFQVVGALVVRSSDLSVIHPRTLTNRALWLSLGFIVAVQVVVVGVPLAHGVFDTVSLTPLQWLVAATMTSLLLLVDESRKHLLRRSRSRTERGRAGRS